MPRAFLMIAVALSLSGCTTSQTRTTPESRVNHVVLCWLKEPGNASHRQSIIATTKTLREIPGVLEIRVGETIPSERKIVDDSFDVCITMAFAGTDDMARYVSHPLHKKAMKEIFGPLVQRFVVYDFVE